MHPRSRTNLFLSHAWGVDSEGRSTHERVRKLNDSLRRMGWAVWFDEERLLLGSNIDVEMSEGIERADAVCICVTRRYVEKINAQVIGDNCAKEWNLSLVSRKRILPLIFERDMLDVSNWPRGVAQMYLAHTLYIDCTGDIQDTSLKLSQMLLLVGLVPRCMSRDRRGPLRHGSRVRRVVRV